MMTKIRRDFGIAVALQIVRARTNHRPNLKELTCDQGRVTQTSDAYGDVKSLLYQVNMPIVKVQIERDVRIPFAKVTDRLMHMAKPEGQR